MKESPHPSLTDRAFGLLVAGVMAVVTAAVWWFSGSVPVWAVVVGAVIGAVAMLAPALLMPLNRLWRGVAARIGVAVNHLVLGIVLYGVLTPVGVLLRVFRGGRSMRTGFDSRAQTYFTSVSRQTDAETMRDWF